MFDRVRTSLHRAITSPFGEGLLPVRLPKDLARRVNMALGKPLCSAEELTRRRTAGARLVKLRAEGASSAASGAAPRVAAPVMIYFEGDRNARLLGRIKDTLEARGIGFTALDVAGDETTKNYVMREARCKEDELPVVFVAASPVGGYNELVAWDVSGKLATAVFGAAEPASAAVAPAPAA
jgi:hypothetical protein